MADTVTNAGLLQNALAAVVTVGSGRGLVVEGDRLTRYVITAAHCLTERPDGQRLQPPHGFSYTEERTYPNLLAPLGGQPSVWCECLFVDPIADIAVLGSPDDQALGDEADAYAALVEAATPLTIAEPPSQPIPEMVARFAELEKLGITRPGPWLRLECPAFLLSLTNQWFSCTVEHSPNGMLNIRDAADGIAAGMSGSPILAEDSTAIGIVCLGGGGLNNDMPTGSGPNPHLMGNLPGWFLQTLADAAAKAEDEAPSLTPEQLTAATKALNK